MNYESVQELRNADQDPSKTGRNPILKPTHDNFDDLFDTPCSLESADGLTSGLVKIASVLNKVQPIIAYNIITK